MKKILAALLAAVLVLGMTACGSEQEKPIGQQIYGVIVDTNPEDRTLTVRDEGEERIFGDSTTIDCEEAPVRPAGSDAAELSFLDLVPGDKVLLSFSEDARKDLQKGKKTVKVIKIEVEPLG